MNSVGFFVFNFDSQAAGNVDSVDTFNLAINDPPTQAQVSALANKLNELIQALQQH